MEKRETLSGSFASDVALLDGILRCDENFDIIKRTLNINETKCVMYYVDGFIKAESMQKLMMHLLSVKDMGDGGEDSAKKFADTSLPAVEVDVQNVIDALVVAVLSGCTAYLSEGFGANALVIDMRTYPARTTSEPENDRVMRGSRDGFVETMIFNTAMIRRRIRDPKFTVKYLSAGTQTRTDMALCYIDGVADGKYVSELTEKISKMECDSLVMGHRSVAETLIKKNWYNPFPKVRTTERPDTVAATLLEGGVVLICDNSPEAMIFPTSIFDFLQETDDYYFPPLTGTYLRIIRQIVFWLTMLLTPVWYLLLSYGDVLPQWLSFIIPEEPGQLPIKIGRAHV